MINYEEDFVNNEVGVHPCAYDTDPNYELLNELVKLDEESLINKAVEIHGAQRYFTKKSFFVDRRIEVLSHALKASPQIVINQLSANIQEFELRDVAKSIVSEAIGIVFGRWSTEKSPF